MSNGVHALPPGLRLGQYEIVTPLTSGGMAAVYLGRHVGPAGFARYVAIKVVHPRFADQPDFVAMFLDEARLSARIEHANVVRVEALGNENGLYYLVMEFIRGSALSSFVRKLAENKRILLPELVVYIMAHVADGLHAAHETTDASGAPLGIVHRDVTPQNVLISYAGAIKLIDFGIAKAAGRSHHTAKGALKGKLRYMAPEQAAGGHVDRRTDVYALGIVLWEMLTYKKLFSAPNDAQLIFMVREPKVTPPRKLAPAVSESLDAVVMQALSPDPEERFQSAQALRRALYEACPEARAIEAQELSTLVRSTMADAIQKEHQMLPASVVSSAGVLPVVDASREEAAMTRIVDAVARLDEEDVSSSPSMLPPEPLPPAAPPLAVTVLNAQLPIAPTRMSLGGPAHVPPAAPAQPPAFGAPTPSAPPQRVSSTPAPRQAAFTPPTAANRSDVMAGRGAPALIRAPGSEPARRSRVGLFFLIAIAVVVTIAVGGLGGWFALSQARQLITP